MRTLIRELAGTLQDVVGLEEAAGFVSVVGQNMGRQINDEYRLALDAPRLSREQVTAVLVDLKRRIKGDFYVIEANQELREANDELRYRNRELQEFASVASHDLQEPLRKVRAFADLLARHLGDGLDEEAHLYLQRIEGATVRMATLITALLELSRVSTRGNPFEPLDLNHVADEVVADLETRIAETAGTVEVDTLPRVEADPTQMRQLFQNLIGNALKFHRPGVPPRVQVSGSVAPVQRTDEGRPQQVCVLRFGDNGIGFEKAYSDRLFSPFQRLHARSAYEGTGMGLAICRRIAERHGGSIEAQSTPGVGSLFVVRLPLLHLTGSEGSALAARTGES